MDKNAPSDFTHAFHAVIGDALKKQVPLDFIVVNLEITKIDLANRFLSERLDRAKNSINKELFGDKTADATPKIDKPNRN